MAVAAAPMDPPTATRGDAPEFLDIDMDQRSWLGMLETQHRPQLLAGRWVKIGQTADPLTDEDSVNCGRGDGQLVFGCERRRDPGGAIFGRPAELPDELLNIGGGAARPPLGR